MALHRPYIRSDVRKAVEERTPKNENGQFIDANTGKGISGQYDLGHKPGHEHWREVERAEREGLTQSQFNDRMNNPDYYQIEDPHENRSHVHEQPRQTQTGIEESNNTSKSHRGDNPNHNQNENGSPDIIKTSFDDARKQKRGVTPKEEQAETLTPSKQDIDNTGNEQSKSPEKQSEQTQEPISNIKDDGMSM